MVVHESKPVLAVAFLLIGMCVSLVPVSAVPPARDAATSSWDRKAAAAYLDQRTTAWTRGGAMDHGTFCISCHTGLPYALGRLAVRAALGERGPSPVEQTLLDSVTKRVRLWAEVQPYLGDKNGGPGTESVLNALILACEDARAGHLSETTRQALAEMWALQLKSGPRAGAWPWISAGNEPWEAEDSEYWGATLAAVAAGSAPDGYLSQPDIQDGLKLLRTYLLQSQENGSLFNRLGLLWADAKVPGLLTAAQRQSIVAAAFAKQQADGGWSTSALILNTWKRHDGSPVVTKTDGYATGLATFALRQAGVPRTDARMTKALAWLAANQDKATGSWPTLSPNKVHDPSSDAGHFMTDAATAYAVLALTSAE